MFSICFRPLKADTLLLLDVKKYLVIAVICAGHSDLVVTSFRNAARPFVLKSRMELEVSGGNVSLESEGENKPQTNS